jgi:L-lactate utilization protein LutC
MNALSVMLEQINIEALIQALRSLGWVEKSPLFDNSVRQFVSPNEKHVALIPLDRRFSDYQRVLLDSLKEIAASKQSTVESLINKLVNPSYEMNGWHNVDNNFLNLKTETRLKMDTEPIDDEIKKLKIRKKTPASFYYINKRKRSKHFLSRKNTYFRKKADEYIDAIKTL